MDEEFKPQSVPDPIFSPGTQPIMPPDTLPSSRMSWIGNFYSNNKWYVWAIVAGLLIMGALAYFAFRTQQSEPVKEADVQVIITAPETAPSGGEVIYKIKIENNDPVALQNMDLELIYPDGVSYVSSIPKSSNLSGSSFKVPELSTGQDVSLIVKTIAQGNINDDKKLTARLRYRFSNFNSEFVKEVTHTVRLVAADVVLDVTGPETTTNAQVVNYDVFYRNNSDKEIDNARIQITYPEGFAYADSNPKPSLGQNIWNIGTLKPQGTGKISFQGTFKSARPGQAATFKMDFLVLDDNGNFFTQGSTTYTTTISSQPLLVEQKLVSNVPNNTVKPGDSIQYEIKFQNNAAVVANGVSVVVQFDSKAIDPASIRSESGQVQDNTITWNGSSLASIGQLNPNESGTVRFSAQVQNPATRENAKDLTVITRVKIKSNEYDNFLPGNEITLKVSSPSSLDGNVKFVGGQLPPKVGQSSTFQVIVDLRNATNDYREGLLIGYIPLGVTFDAGSVSSREAGNVKYDASTGKLTWAVGQLLANTGSFSPLRTLSFNVRFTPTAGQSGQPVMLFKNIAFTGTDIFTNQAVSLKTADLETSDIEETSQGRVTQ
ncbi:MAG: hypothetical protein M3Q64_00790 [bacterium]|nr:hypothetical protein [bacterium]